MANSANITAAQMALASGGPGMFCHCGLRTNLSSANVNTDQTLFQLTEASAATVDSLVSTAKAAGMSYFCFTALHEGELCLWNSTSDSRKCTNVTQASTGNKYPDFCALVVAACVKYGLDVWFYHGIFPSESGFNTKTIAHLQELAAYGTIKGFWIDFAGPDTNGWFPSFKTAVEAILPSALVLGNTHDGTYNTSANETRTSDIRILEIGTTATGVAEQGIDGLAMTSIPAQVCDTIDVGAFWFPLPTLQSLKTVTEIAALRLATKTITASGINGLNYILNCPVSPSGRFNPLWEQTFLDSMAPMVDLALSAPKANVYSTSFYNTLGNVTAAAGASHGPQYLVNGFPWENNPSFFNSADADLAPIVGLDCGSVVPLIGTTLWSNWADGHPRHSDLQATVYDGSRNVVYQSPVWNPADVWNAHTALYAAFHFPPGTQGRYVEIKRLAAISGVDGGIPYIDARMFQVLASGIQWQARPYSGTYLNIPGQINRVLTSYPTGTAFVRQVTTSQAGTITYGPDISVTLSTGYPLRFPR